MISIVTAALLAMMWVGGANAYLLSEEARDRFGSPGDTSGGYTFKVAVGTNEANAPERTDVLKELMDAIDAGWANNPVNINPQGYYYATPWAKAAAEMGSKARANSAATVSTSIAAEAAARQRLNEADGGAERTMREGDLQRQRENLKDMGVDVPW